VTEVEAAAYWLDWIRLGKNVGAFLVAIGVAAEFLGDFVAKPYEDKIEADRKSEITRLNNETAKLTAEAEAARASIVDAQARAAEANQKAEVERLERVRIEKAIIDELAQRDLKRDQIETISSAIKGRVGTIYLYPLSDPEASRYAFAISAALKAGGADVKLMLSGTRDVPVFPDKFNVAISITGVTIYQSDGKHEIVDLLVDAFRQAGITIQGQWSEKALAGVVEGKWVADAGVQSPAVFVGLRPPPFSQFPAYATPPHMEEFLKTHPPPWAPK